MFGASPTISKLYISNFLTGLVFFYGIEKLFLQSIGIGPVEIGWLMIALLTITLVFDIPSGILADRWSRKGLLISAMACLAISALLGYFSDGFWMMAASYVFFGFYLVGTSGTFHAIIYDVAHEEGRADQYSKIMGFAYGLFLCGAGVANIASGFLAQIDLALPYLLSAIPCLINIVLLLTVKEPTFHKKEQKEKILGQIVTVSQEIWHVLLLRSLVFMYLAIGVAELFKLDFSQLYILNFGFGPVALGLLWAAYAFMWALGSYLAHRLTNYLHLMLALTLGSYVVLSVWHSPWSLVIYMVQIFATGVAINAIETRMQNATPSAVRASVLSVLATGNRLLAIPFSIIFGWLIANHTVYGAVVLVAVVTAGGLVYWVVVGRRRLDK